jgi:hypothetical protein
LQYENVAAGKKVPVALVEALYTMFVVTDEGSRVMPWMKSEAGSFDLAYSTVQTSLREAVAAEAVDAMAAKAKARGVNGVRITRE